MVVSRIVKQPRYSFLNGNYVNSAIKKHLNAL